MSYLDKNQGRCAISLCFSTETKQIKLPRNLRISKKKRFQQVRVFSPNRFTCGVLPIDLLALFGVYAGIIFVLFYGLPFYRKLWQKPTNQPNTLPGQIIATSAEVTPNGGLVRESPQNPLNSGLGIIVICPDLAGVCHTLVLPVVEVFRSTFFRSTLSRWRRNGVELIRTTLMMQQLPLPKQVTG